jgi:glutamyl-tRNA reductase
MHWSMISWSHHRTPLDVREKLAFTSEQIRDALEKLKQLFPDAESVLLSTCNRVELYCAAKSLERLPDTLDLASFVTNYHGLSLEDLQEQVTAFTEEEAVKHLFMVAASLDSMIVGEAQILSQVKGAYELACGSQTASAIMHRAFQRATVVARRVANETEIHKRRISVPSVAVSEIASEFFERFDDKRILLIGAGEMGMETLRYLKDAGAENIRITNRNVERAQELASSFNAQVMPWDELGRCLAEADLVVSTTSSSQPIVTTEQFRSIRSRRPQAVLILDLAVPRDFEPGIADLPEVYLFSVDDLQQVCDRNIQLRQEQWPKAAHIVEQETKRFLSESVFQGSGPTIKQLREQAQQVKEEEYSRLLTKLQTRGLDSQAQKEIEIAFDRLVNKLLHPPLQSLRENADTTHHASLVDALRRLFQLKD